MYYGVIINGSSVTVSPAGHRHVAGPRAQCTSIGIIGEVLYTVTVTGYLF